MQINLRDASILPSYLTRLQCTLPKQNCSKSLEFKTIEQNNDILVSFTLHIPRP